MTKLETIWKGTAVKSCFVGLAMHRKASQLAGERALLQQDRGDHMWAITWLCTSAVRPPS